MEDSLPVFIRAVDVRAILQDSLHILQVDAVGVVTRLGEAGKVLDEVTVVCHHDVLLCTRHTGITHVNIFHVKHQANPTCLTTVKPGVSSWKGQVESDQQLSVTLGLIENLTDMRIFLLE